MNYLGIDLGTSSVKLILMGADGTIPVSYTHLDVYKRQLVLRAPIGQVFSRL